MNKKIRTPIAAYMLIVLAVLRIFDVLKLTELRVHNSFYVSSALVIEIVIDLVLCGILFAKKYNNILVIALGCNALLDVIYLVTSFSIYNLLYLAAHALLTVHALAACEQTLIKADLSKIRDFSNKLFNLPAIIYLIPDIILSLRGGTLGMLGVIKLLLGGFTLLSIGAWLKNPYSEIKPNISTNSSEGINDEVYCGLGKHILLLLFTFGIWNLIWTYRTTKYLNKSPNAEYYNPTNKLLLFIFVPFYSIYWFYKHGQRIDSFNKSKGINNSDMATLCLILGIFIPIVACIIMQDKINTLCTSKAANTASQEQPQTTDELKKYKELLDSGIITQEEFDAKKKQLLGL